MEKHMKSSNTSTCESLTSRPLSCRQELGREILLGTTTRELVEFYWTHRKRFSGGYRSFPIEVIEKSN